MKIEEFNFLVETNQINLAAAYAILMNSGECALLRNFHDVVNLTNRMRVAEKLIKNERNSRLKNKVEERIEWYKTSMSMHLTTFENHYAGMLAAERAEPNDVKHFYDKVLKIIERKDQYLDFYTWILAIDKII